MSHHHSPKPKLSFGGDPSLYQTVTFSVDAGNFKSLGFTASGASLNNGDWVSTRVAYDYAHDTILSGQRDVAHFSNSGNVFQTDHRGAAQFDGVNGYAVIQAAPGGDKGFGIARQYAIEVWMEGTSVQDNGIFSLYSNYDGIRAIWPDSSGNANYLVTDVNGNQYMWQKNGFPAIELACYHFTVDINNQLAVYRNGQLVDPDSVSGSIMNPDVGQSGVIAALKESGDVPFKGKIYSFKIYNYGFTAADAEQNFQALRGRFGI